MGLARVKNNYPVNTPTSITYYEGRIMKIIDENYYFKTADLSLAVSLSLFCPLESINKQPNSNRGFFIFKRSKELDALIASYYKKEMRVEPSEYFNQLKITKVRLYGTE